jgi:hypothetical protein
MGPATWKGKLELATDRYWSSLTLTLTMNMLVQQSKSTTAAPNKTHTQHPRTAGRTQPASGCFGCPRGTKCSGQALEAPAPRSTRWRRCHSRERAEWAGTAGCTLAEGTRWCRPQSCSGLHTGLEGQGGGGGMQRGPVKGWRVHSKSASTGKWVQRSGRRTMFAPSRKVSRGSQSRTCDTSKGGYGGGGGQPSEGVGGEGVGVKGWGEGVGGGKDPALLTRDLISPHAEL